jgi:hypothetical protein
MARQNVSAGAGMMPLEPDTPLRDLGPGNQSKLTPEQRARSMKRTKKGVPNHAALVTPQSILGKLGR